jgi:hypothetical protein
MADDNLVDVLTKRKPAADRELPREQPDESQLPDPKREYEPYSRPANRPLYTLHFILGSEGYRSFPLVQLDSYSTFTADARGHVIRLRFCGSRTYTVTIVGRALRKLYDYLGQHRIAFVARVDEGRDFGADDQSVVTAIDIEEVKDREGC